MKLNNAVVLLTGASQGIGRALALQLDLQGCRLLLVGRNAAALESVAAECRRDGRSPGAGITTRRAVYCPVVVAGAFGIESVFPYTGGQYDDAGIGDGGNGRVCEYGSAGTGN